MKKESARNQTLEQLHERRKQAQCARHRFPPCLSSCRSAPRKPSAERPAPMIAVSRRQKLAQHREPHQVDNEDICAGPGKNFQSPLDPGDSLHSPCSRTRKCSRREAQQREPVRRWKERRILSKTDPASALIGCGWPGERETFMRGTGYVAGRRDSAGVQAVVSIP